ncbi:hypothetical protein EBT16_10210 [bacterium]|nr:hypothetical protein [bacterium]
MGFGPSTCFCPQASVCQFQKALSAWALFEPLRKKQVSSFVQTAAASQLGRMVLRLSKKYHVPGIHVVHRPDLVEALKKEGADCVLDSSHPQFENELKAACERFEVQYAIDAVAGEMTGILARSILAGGELSVYGVLSGKPCEVDAGELIFRNVQVKGFWLSHYLKDKNPFEMMRLFFDLKKLLKREGATQISRRLSLEETLEEFKRAPEPTSYGKTLVTPVASI